MAERNAHDRAVELTIAALDFDLDPAERAWLDGHITGCSACRETSLSFAADARRLERLPQVGSPDRVRARVLGSRGRSGGPVTGGRPWLATAAALGLVAAVGGALLLRPGTPPPGPGTSLAPSTSGAVSVTPSAGGPSVSASGPVVSSGPSDVPGMPGRIKWQPLAVPDQASPRELRALASGAGIAVATLVGADGEPRLWWSRDGGAWSDAELAAGTFGGTAPWLVQPFGAGFVALGWTDLRESATERRIWVSPDGLAWRPDTEASGRLGPITYGLLAATNALALVAGRTEAGETLVWRSTDGETWSELELDGSLRDAELDGLAATEDGFLAFGRLDGAPRIWRTSDGARWNELATPPGLATLHGLSTAAGGYLAWGATAIEQRTSNALAWSPDGRAWTAVAPPAPVAADDQLVWITDDGSGLVALWRRLDGSAVLGRSPDGRSWTPVTADGLPAGVQLDQVVRVGERLIALGRDAERRVVSFTATP